MKRKNTYDFIISYYYFYDSNEYDNDYNIDYCKDDKWIFIFAYIYFNVYIKKSNDEVKNLFKINDEVHDNLSVQILYEKINYETL